MAALLFCACTSKPTQDGAQGKVTTELVSNMIELEAVVAYAPRRPQELQDAILLSPKVQTCLRHAPEVREAAFTLGLEGYLNYKGEIEGLHAVHSSEPLKACMLKEIRALPFGRGRMGPFKMQLIRAQSTGKKPKGILLDLSPGKKFE